MRRKQIGGRQPFSISVHELVKRQECGISYLSLCRAMTSSWNRFESETKRAENPHTFTIRFWWRSGCACASSSSSTELQFGCRRVAFAVHRVHSTLSSPSNGDMIPHPADGFKPARRAAMERRPYHFYGSAGRLAPPLGTKHEAPTGTAAETTAPHWRAAILAAHGLTDASGIRQAVSGKSPSCQPTAIST